MRQRLRHGTGGTLNTRLWLASTKYESLRGTLTGSRTEQGSLWRPQPSSLSYYSWLACDTQQVTYRCFFHGNALFIKIMNRRQNVRMALLPAMFSEGEERVAPWGWRDAAHRGAGVVMVQGGGR